MEQREQSLHSIYESSRAGDSFEEEFEKWVEKMKKIYRGFKVDAISAVLDGYKKIALFILYSFDKE